MINRLEDLVRLAALSVWFLGSSASGLPVAPESGCKITVPVTVYLPDGTLIRKLGINEFLVKSEGNAVRIDSLAEDSAPKRIVLVVETGKQVSETVRKIEASLIAKILSDMRPEDSVALITSHGPLKEFHFGENRDNLTTAVGEFAGVPEGRNQSKGILDSIKEAATWLTPHRQGDAIIAFSLGVGHFQSQIGFNKVRDFLTSNGIRLFGFQFSEIVAGIGQRIPPVPSGLVGKVYINQGRESLLALTAQTGGFVFIEPVEEPSGTYKLTTQRLAVLETGAVQIYKAIKEYYALTLTSPGSFEIDVSGSVRAKVPHVAVAYPRDHEVACTN